MRAGHLRVVAGGSLGYILEVKRTAFSKGLDVEGQRKGKMKN